MAKPRKYYVYDPGVTTDLGKVAVAYDNDEKKEGAHVMLNDVSARYLLDQGLIGREPLDRLDDDARAHLHQVSRGRVAMSEQQQKRFEEANQQSVEKAKQMQEKALADARKEQRAEVKEERGARTK